MNLNPYGMAIVTNFALNKAAMMWRLLTYILTFCFVFLFPDAVVAQCSICTKTAQQLGEGPAKALNSAIIYLAFAPLLLIGFIGYRWWKNNRDT
jgi:hypothetical protein